MHRRKAQVETEWAQDQVVAQTDEDDSAKMHAAAESLRKIQLAGRLQAVSELGFASHHSAQVGSVGSVGIHSCSKASSSS